MVWAILLINILIVVVSLKKRVLPYALLTICFIFLVVGQAIQISSDMDGITGVSYLYAFISRDGLTDALWFVLGVSTFSLLLVSCAGGYRKNSQPVVTQSFSPPTYFYVAILFYLGLVSSVLIFAVVGIHQFLTSSRPGYQTGATIFIVLLILGLVPLLLKLIYRSRVNKGDVLCFVIAAGVTGGFSRIHVILYATILVVVLFYCRNWSDAKMRIRDIAGAGLIGAVFGLSFFAVGAIRDAENYTGGSLSLIVKYILDHPDKSLLSLSANYRISVEGMSGLAGALTDYVQRQHAVNYDFGVLWVAKGLIQWLPGFVKPHLGPLNEYLDSLNWYSDSIIPPGVESSFESFGWLGIPFYSISFFCLAWLLPLSTVTKRFSGILKLSAFILVGCTIFFVRGSFIVWIAYCISYLAVIFASWPLFKRWIRPLALLKSAGHEGQI